MANTGGTGTGVAKKAGTWGAVIAAAGGLGTAGVQYAENASLQRTILAMQQNHQALAITCMGHLAADEFAERAAEFEANRAALVEETPE